MNSKLPGLFRKVGVTFIALALSLQSSLATNPNSQSLQNCLTHEVSLAVQKTPKKVVILMASLGGGHKASGSAIEARIKALDPTAQITYIDMNDYTTKIGKATIRLSWDFIRPRSAWLYDFLYRHFSDRESNVPKTFHQDAIIEAINKENPDSIIANIAEGAVVLANMKKTNRITPHVTTAWYHSNYFVDQMPGVSKYIDKNFMQSKEIEQKFFDAGVSAQQLHVSGTPIFKDYYLPLDKKKFFAEQGLREDQKLVVLLGGADGTLPYEQMIRSLARSTQETIQVCAVTGTGERAFKKLTRLQSDLPPNIRLIIKPNLDRAELSQWARAADLYVPKAGGNAPAEAFVANIPTIVANTVRGQETANANFYQEQGLALMIQSPKDLGAQAQRIFHDSKLQATMSQAQTKFRNDMDVDSIARFALGIDNSP